MNGPDGIELHSTVATTTIGYQSPFLRTVSNAGKHRFSKNNEAVMAFCRTALLAIGRKPHTRVVASQTDMASMELSCVEP